jgi:hypothetical protein
MLGMTHISTCRLCKKASFDAHKYPMIKYGVRHSAHADCALGKWGVEFFDRLTPWQLTQFPALAAYDAGLLDKLGEAIAARPNVVKYRSPLGGQ